MLKSFIVSAVLGASVLGGGQYYATGAVPFLDAPTTALPAPTSAVAAAAALPAPMAPVAACGGPVAPTPAPAPAAVPAAVPANASGLINLNTATDAELDTLPDTGTARIRRITDARKRGPIRSVDSLAGPGMPAGYLNAIRPYVTV